MDKQIAIVGAGAVGCVLAAHLTDAGVDPIICDVNTEILEAVRLDGISITGVRSLEAHPGRIVTSIEDFADDPPDIIFLAVKATALPLIAHSIGGFYRKGMTVVNWQNGIDIERVISDEIGPEPVVRAVVNYGCSLVGPGRAELIFEQPPHCVLELAASSREKAEEIAELLTSCGLETERAENLNSMVWRKTIMNASLSPVCAMTGANIAAVMQDLYASELVDNLIKEGVRVARANEISLGWDFYRWAKKYLLQAGPHKPSMANDLQAGRLTEIDFINGKIVEFGNYAGIDTVYNRTMVSLVKTLEKTGAMKSKR